MKKWFKQALAGSVIAVSALAYGVSTVAADEYTQVKRKVESIIGLEVSSIADSPMPGVLQLFTERGLFYTSQDGKYLMHGRMFNLDEGMRNETEQALAQVRLQGIEKFEGSMIEFKAKNERHVINVFTDITCGYCRKLHNEIDQYTANGVTVRYLAFPRGGVESPTFDNMVSVWCAEDKQQALTDAKNGKSVSKSSCENAVKAQYAFGLQVGVTGTPNIILEDGSVIGGYQPAPVIIESLKTI